MKKFMKDIKSNETGFTLLEVIVAVAIVGVIGSLALQMVIKADTSMQISNVQSFMDNITQSAKEAYKSDPEGVLFNPTKPYPFTKMVSTSATTDKDSNEGNTTYTRIFEKTYSANLSPLKLINDEKSEYKVVIEFKPESKTNEASNGFDYKAAEYKMESKMYAKDNKDRTKWKVEPLYDKTYSFENIGVKNHGLSPIKYATITFDTAGGTLVPTDSPRTIDRVIGDSIGAIEQEAKKQNYLFKGWSTSPTGTGYDTSVIDSTYKITGDTTLYAKYLNDKEYVVQFVIDPGIQSFNVTNVEPKAKEVELGIKVDSTTTAPPIKNTTDKDNKVKGGDMFAKNAVSEKGKVFVGWQDSSGKMYTPDSKVDPRYTILTPVFKDRSELEKGQIEQINLELDISDTFVQGKDGKEYKNILYPYSDVEFTFTVDKEGHAIIKENNYQKEESESIIKSLNSDKFYPASKKVPESSLEFNSKDGKLAFIDKDGTTRYETINEYYKSLKLNSKFEIINIKNITIKLTYKGLDVSEFTAHPVDKKDSVKTSGGNTVNDAQLNTLFGIKGTGTPDKPKLSAKKITFNDEDQTGIAMLTALNKDFKKIVEVSIDSLDVKENRSTNEKATSYDLSSSGGDGLHPEPIDGYHLYDEVRIVYPTSLLPWEYVIKDKRGNLQFWYYSSRINNLIDENGKKDKNFGMIQINGALKYADRTNAIGFERKSQMIGEDSYINIMPAKCPQGHENRISRIKVLSDGGAGHRTLDIQGSSQLGYATGIGDPKNDSRIIFEDAGSIGIQGATLSQIGIYGHDNIYGVNELYADNLRDFWNLPGKWFNDENYRKGNDKNAVKGTTTSILTLAPANGEKPILPSWLTSQRRTS
ncbi:MAG: InlB B-repeat-containing protein [Bacilli bacterium]